MQAYQSAPCPYCGATWNPPGAQTCTNCRNQLPPPPPAYAPPGYAPSQGQPPAAPDQSGGYPYGSPAYPLQPDYSQPPGSYPGPQGYPGQPGQYQGQPQPPPQPGQYQGYPPPAGYPQYQGYPQQGAPYGQVPGYPGYPPAAPDAASASSTLRLFGQTFTIPLALPPAVLQYQQAIAYGALALVGVLVLVAGVLPAVAASQISAANQAISATVSHQSKVDAGFTSLFAPDSGSADLNVVKAQETKFVKSINDSLAIVQGDESTLGGAEQRLAILQWVALPSRTTIAAERQRLKTALDGLKQADTALTAGSNMGKVILPLDDAMIDFTKMYTALGKRDLVGAAAPYPDAQQKLEDAISHDQAPGVPSIVPKQLTALNDLLNNTESLVQAIQSKDAAGIKKYSDALQAGLKNMSSLSLPQDYAIKTYGPNQKAYDAAMKSLKS
jgi:hypothetical protein